MLVKYWNTKSFTRWVIWSETKHHIGRVLRTVGKWVNCEWNLLRYSSYANTSFSVLLQNFMGSFLLKVQNPLNQVSQHNIYPARVFCLCQGSYLRVRHVLGPHQMKAHQIFLLWHTRMQKLKTLFSLLVDLVLTKISANSPLNFVETCDSAPKLISIILSYIQKKVSFETKKNTRVWSEWKRRLPPVFLTPRFGSSCRRENGKGKRRKTRRTGCMIVTAPVFPQSLQKVIKVLTLVGIFYQLSGLIKAQRKKDAVKLNIRRKHKTVYIKDQKNVHHRLLTYW